jgi:protein involved in polysaccharide export with SLBB domain
MGDLRSISVFVLGDVSNPGSYLVSSLASMTHALVVSGGISDIGSMRDIQLKRKGKLVGHLDLYDLLLRGDNKNDARLSAGDVIFVPPVGATVGVAGAVRRPAIYEVKGRNSVADVIALAGGLLPDAHRAGVKLQRVDESSQRMIVGLDLGNPDALRTEVRSGDVIDVPKALETYRNAVTLVGHVQRPGMYPWRSGLRLTHLLPSALDVLSGADLDYVLIRRESPTDLKLQVLAASLLEAQSDPGGVADIELQARDTVSVFALEYGRQRVIEPLLEQLARQSTLGSEYVEVRVGGRVRAPGRYPMVPSMRISDLIRAGGNLSENAFALEAELARSQVIDGERRETEIISVDLAQVLAGSPDHDLLLQPHDYLSIKTISQWEGVWQVTLAGEVKFPGTYTIRRGETLNSVITRAGGLTDLAFPEGAVFLREDLKIREKEQMEVLARRLESDLASLSLQSLDSTGSEALTVGQSLLAQLRSAEPVGRLVVDLQSLSDTGQLDLARDIEMKDGDQLLVPRRSQEVTVLGEVQYATSHIFQPGLAREEYIAKSGGLTRRADKSLIYVVRASGAVVAGSSSKWFGGGSVEIRPGDSIVVPMDTDRIRPLTFWTNVTQILYQGALAVAAIKTFNN